MKLFEKNEITFAVILIVVYVIGVSMMQRVSEAIGIGFLAEMLFCIALCAVLLIFICKNGLTQYLGLKAPAVSAGKMLLYLPLLLLGGIGLCFGIGAEFSITESVTRTVMMLCVGFLEEVIFRGFLFRGIAKQNLTRGVVISSLTFAIGHFVNLLNGSDILENTLQVLFAAAVGFLLVFIFMRTESILPCILFHGFNNCMTAFATGALLKDRLGDSAADLLIVSVQMVIAGAYLLYITKLPKRSLPEKA